jgi:hypothetical protein
VDRFRVVLAVPYWQGVVTMMAPSTLTAEIELHPELPSGRDERFAGFGVMGLPFASGHVLALRRFPASSIGPAYTSVWHRDPVGRWAFWQDQADDQACSRYFGSALAETRRCSVELDWPAESTMRVAVAEVDFAWTVTMAASPVTRALNAVGSVLPDTAWRAHPVLAVMGHVAGTALRAGRVAMAGKTPNGQRFVANPLRIWLIKESSARLGDENFGPPGPLGEQARLGDFWIPQRGVFTVGRIFFAAS